MSDSYRYLWAKADRKDPEKIHRLIYHLIDVGQVAKALWQASLPESMRSRISEGLGLSDNEAMATLAFWAALHDLGKASPAFQNKLRGMISVLRQQGFDLPDQFEKPATHDVITAWAIQSEHHLQDSCQNLKWEQGIALVLSGHHGAWRAFDAISNVPASEYGGPIWATARLNLVSDLKTIFKPPRCNPTVQTSERNSLLTQISGFVSVVDWLGSNENLFPYQDELVDLEEYASNSERLAWDGLQSQGWLNSLNDPIQFDFARLFLLFSPSAIQQKIIDLAGAVPLPSLVIIESPTGSGKTEAALSLYALWTQSMKRPGLYIAMPTTATSDQMHERVTKFLSVRHQMDIQPLLVHSRALLRESETKTNQMDKVDEDLALRQTWFLPRKRSLLAPFGVGTVDQTFLSVLQTRHFFVRLFGLSHKVVIFDEVHAYDAYMAEIFCRLLCWLRAVGTSVILLSATLPGISRRRFVEAYTGIEDATDSIEYPRLTIASGEVQVFPLPLPEARPPLEIEWVSRKDEEIIAKVRTELQTGGCIAIICNTVRRAQEVYQVLAAANQENFFCPADNLVLFHARTTQVWRDETQIFVLKALSKEARQKNERPSSMVVVATQVIEQSLDLDFDVMLTDLAPIDLLVQRAGRLHRHPPRQRYHPYRLLITSPEMQSGIPCFPRTEYPYEPYFLFYTWAVLKDTHSLTLTEDAPRLIEQVYGDSNLTSLPSELAEVIETARQKCELETATAERKAGSSLLAEPGYAALLGKSNLDLEEDNPDVNQALRALTRCSAPGISLVCLHRVNGLVYLDPDGDSLVDVEDPSNAQVLGLARRVISVQSNSVVEHFSAQEPPPRWKKIAALRYARLAIFENDEYPVSLNCTLRLTHGLGLQIEYHKSGGIDDEL